MNKVQYDNTISKKEIEVLESQDSLFHYTNLDTAIEFILKNKKIKFSSFKTTNDPFEYSQKLLGTAGFFTNEEDIKDASPLKRNINKILKHNIFFLSTSKNKKSANKVLKGFSNLRMWSEYGQDHKGVCLILSKKKLLTQINKIKNVYGKYSKKIIYKPFVDQKIFLDTNEIDWSLSDEKQIKNYFKKYNQIHLFTKYSDYKDENEYRFIIINMNKDNDIFVPIDDALTGIILGDRYNAVYLPSIIKLLNGYKCYSLKWVAGQFLMEKQL